MRPRRSRRLLGKSSRVLHEEALCVACGGKSHIAGWWCGWSDGDDCGLVVRMKQERDEAIDSMKKMKTNEACAQWISTFQIFDCHHVITQHTARWIL